MIKSRLRSFIKGKYTVIIIKLMGDCISSGKNSNSLRKASLESLDVAVYRLPLDQLEECLKPQLLFLPSQYQYFKSTMEQSLRQNNQDMKVFKNRSELQQYKEDCRNNILVVGCKSPEDAYALRQLPNFHTFSLIGIACDFNPKVIPTIAEKCRAEMGFRFGGIFPYRSEQIAAFVEEASKGRHVYFCHRDIGHLYRSLLAFECFFRRSLEYSPVQFYKWAKRTPEGQELVSRMQTLVMSKKDMGNFITNNIFSENLPLLTVIQQLRLTKNPGIMAHTAWLCSTLFDFIRISYAKTKQKLRELKIDEFVVWLPLTKTELRAIEQIIERKSIKEGKQQNKQNFMFPSFVLGYTNINFVPPDSKALYKFFINIPPDLEKYDPQVDLGFYFDQDRVIFNIQNIFRMDGYDKSDRTIHATYCSIGRQHGSRSKTLRYAKDAHNYNIRMFKILDYYKYTKPYIQNQLDLCFALQFYHQYKNMLKNELIHKGTKGTIDSTNTTLLSTANSLREELHPSKSLFQKIGDAELQTGDFEAAQNSYDRVKAILRAYIKKMNLYLASDKRPAFRQTLQDIVKYKNDNQIGILYNFEGLAINNFIALMTSMMSATSTSQSKQGDNGVKAANQMIKKCISMCSQLYKSKYVDQRHLHEQAYDIFPLYYMTMTTKLRIDINSLKNVSKNKYEDKLNEIEQYKQQCSQMAKYFDGVHMFWLPQQ